MDLLVYPKMLSDKVRIFPPLVVVSCVLLTRALPVILLTLSRGILAQNNNGLTHKQEQK